MTAAVPSVIGTDFSDAPPGHRFRLYFSGWWTKSVDKERIEVLKKQANDNRNNAAEIKRLNEHLSNTLDFTERDDEETQRCLSAVTPTELPKAWKEAALALQRRQQSVSTNAAAVMWTKRTKLVSPLVIGTGVEHPLENGHLFFDPHGLPFLPGSSIKGTLRRAAEELALFEEPANRPARWTLPLVWLLFGFDENAGIFRDDAWRKAYREHLGTLGEADLWPLYRLDSVREALEIDARASDGEALARVRAWLERLGASSVDAPDKDAPDKDAPDKEDKGVLRVRGALDCWDAFFGPPRMRVDIMNPHFGDYYQENQPPHETGAPNPIYFLAVEVGVEATFYVQWRPPRGVERAVGADWNWKVLVERAFDHAARNLGFGAKTAVGYGRFETATNAIPATAAAPTAGTASSAAASADNAPTAAGHGGGSAAAARAPAATQAPSSHTEQVTVKWDPGAKQLEARVSRGKLFWKASPGKVDVLAQAGALGARIKEKKEHKVFVTYEVSGNQLTLVGLSETDPTKKPT
jgi:CRISPR-associated protein Cmr6